MACVECLESDDCSAGVCDVSSMACVECLSDDDCGGSLSRCDATANTCVECLADTECDDADACTFDSCDPATWSCRHEIRSECLDAGTPDAGTPDAGTPDGGAVEPDASTPPVDAGTGPVMDGGCGCRAAGGTGTTAPVWLLGLALLLWRRRSR
jgi:MYXO-CTERM domain-containing protein